jgi:hypothetical protein
VGKLADDCYYVVTITYPHDGEEWKEEQWLKGTDLEVPDYIYGLLWGGRELRWRVRVMRQTGIKPDGSMEGEAVGRWSEMRTFFWYEVPPPGEPEPRETPTATIAPPTPTPVPPTPTPTFERP